MIARSRILTIVLGIAALALPGCASLGFYSQAVTGHTELMLKQAPIATWLEDAALEKATRHKLQLAQALRRFSILELGLPDNDSYTYYADLERPYVVWTVFATEEFSLQPKAFCFLIVGCLQYRGYFSEAAARRDVQELQTAGYDVYMGGVAAYSTLGWFDDPLLNTMLNWSDADLARVMFHELAHQLIYVRDDTAFNESFAEAVALIGVRRWLASRGNPDELARLDSELRRESEFIELVLRYRQKLQQLYDSGEAAATMRSRKQVTFMAMQAEYEAMKAGWQHGHYDNWFRHELNNARLASVSIYRKYTADMLAIFAELGENIPAFYDIMRAFGRCRAEQRQTLLQTRRLSAVCEK